jgi:RNA polymerase sigma factor (TIGR02999 family)
MPEPPATNVTALLDRLRAGDTGAADDLLAVVYGELRALAGAIFASPNPAHTLQPTALVHEAWLKLGGRLDAVEGRAHFFALAALAMRQILADHAKAMKRQKRGGEARRVTLVGELAARTGGGLDPVEIDDCLRRLSELNERHAKVASFRLLGGMTIPEIARVLGISPRSVDSDWSMARAWLGRELVGP